MRGQLLLRFAVIFLIVLAAFLSWYSAAKTDALEGDVGRTSSSIQDFFMDLGINLRWIGQFMGLSEQGYCPYINPYTSDLFSSGTLSVSGGSLMFDALHYVAYGDSTYYDFSEYIDRSGEFPLTLPSQLKAPKCDGFLSFETVRPGEFLISCDGRPETTMTYEDVAERLNEYARMSGFGIFLRNKIPVWQCMFFFGLFPLLSMIFLLRDALYYVPAFSRRVKFLIILFISLVAILTGGFARFIWYLAYLASINVGGAFLLILLSMIFLSVLLSWLAQLQAAQARAARETERLAKKMASQLTTEALVEALSPGQTDIDREEQR